MHDQIEIFNKNKIHYSTKIVSAILDRNDKNETEFIVCYDKFTKIEDIILEIWTPEGKKVKSVKKKEMQDISAVNESTIATDVRCLTYECNENLVPYIIKTEYSTISSQSFHIDSHSPIYPTNTSIIKSNFLVINHDTMNKVRFNETIWGQPNIEKKLETINYSWEMTGITPAFCKKILESESSHIITPILESFQMDNVEGEMKTWKSFGQWLSKLNEGMDILDEKTQVEIKAIAGLETDKKAIVRKLYNYLQDNMRYVSIQLGIGGFKPMPAQDVHNYKYGDCKALSNYMKTMLNIVDIPSNYIIIMGGQNPRYVNIQKPHNPFNHAILAVPLEGDTIFLECTSQTNPFGYQGSFTGNRMALLVDGENSKLIKTKSYTYKDNIISNNIDITDLNELLPSIRLKQTLSGIGIEYLNYHFISALPDDKFAAYVLDNGFEGIDKLKLVQRNYPYNYEYTFSSSKKILKTGSRIFVDVNIVGLPQSIRSDLGKEIKK
ncbi:MAG: transglutaminase domain-containing protein [Saprospiraceae bacterium]|nr:transglutaminase domain-containing protein [Saprospiraceae bacterium]